MRDAGTSAEHVEDLEHVIRAQRQRGRLEQQQDERRDNPHHPEAIDDRLNGCVDQVGDRRHQQQGKQLGGQHAPLR